MSDTTGIKRLVEKFEEHKDSYKSGKYNEAQLRQEFLDPFFAALGWDIENIEGYAEAYKEVVHEDALKVGGATKAPDYSFRIGGVRKFFVEAKKPSINIKDDIHPAFQLRSYAWSAKLSLSIVTDFEEFAVYDCRIEPKKTDKASKGRILYFTFDQYVEKWDEIQSIFSRESILKGQFDKYAESKKPRGTTEVDDVFLKEMEEWRKSIASNLALRNPALTQRELNNAVQLTIDRIIFLRICEDRGIEKYGRLRSLNNGANIYMRMVELFREADDKYNSGLFHFAREKDRPGEPDSLTPTLNIDDKPLKDVLKRLYYPESPYIFAVISADILGQVYERFLGKVIRLTAGHHAKIEEKPEVRKAGGVYYTPTYIVEYIVKNTVGKLVEGKTPQKVSKIRILDPACGSGSFLLGAYRFLLDWHRDWYAGNDPKKYATGKNPKVFLFAENDWRLTASEKKRILLNNIYGVDIDTQAVEVTKLSLLLKVLEGESQETLLKQFQLFKERALPDLRANIKCGNSLIGPDFYEGKDLSLFGEDEQYRINVFDWHSEFAPIMKAGGFDAVIGNPPYVRPHNITVQDKEYFWQQYRTFTHKSDLYCCFIERSISLLRPSGLFSYIVSHGWLRLRSFQVLRQLFLNQSKILALVELPFKVFAKATVTTGIFVLQKETTSKNHEIDVVLGEQKGGVVTFQTTKTIPQNIFQSTFQNVFDISITPETESIKDKMRHGQRIGDCFDICFGLKTADDTKFLHKIQGQYKEDQPLLRGDDIKRYAVHYKGEYVWYVPDEMRKNRKTARPGEPLRFEQPKVLVKDTSADFGSTYDNSHHYVKDVLIVIPKINIEGSFNLRFVTGVLNSRLMYFYYRTTFKTIHVQNKELASLPLPSIELSNANDQKKHDRMVELVETMLDLNKKLPEAKTDHNKNLIQRQIDYTDNQIDKLVYELYDLNEEEIKIVEGE